MWANKTRAKTEEICRYVDHFFMALYGMDKVQIGSQRLCMDH